MKSINQQIVVGLDSSRAEIGFKRLNQLLKMEGVQLTSLTVASTRLGKGNTVLAVTVKGLNKQLQQTSVTLENVRTKSGKLTNEFKVQNIVTKRANTIIQERVRIYKAEQALARQRAAAMAKEIVNTKKLMAINASLNALFAKQARLKAAAAFAAKAQSFAGAAGAVANTPQAMQKQAAALAPILGQIQRGSVSITRANEMFNVLSKNSSAAFKAVTAGEQRAVASIRRFISATKESGAAMDRTGRTIKLAWTTIFRLMQIQALHVLIGRVILALTESVRAAKEYSIKIAEVQTISQRAGKTSEQWAKQLRGVSDAFGVSLLDVAEGAYQALSNQVVNATQSIMFLNTAAALSKITVSTLTDAVSILSSVINSFKLGNFQAAQVSAQLFKTVELGRVRITEMANSIGNSTGLASQLSISFGELNASFITLTRQGVKFDTAQTLINNVMLKLLKPTKELQGLFDEWGVSSGEAAIQTFGLFGVLRKLVSEAESGGATRLGDLFGRLRAIRGISGLVANIDIFTDSLTKLGEAGKDAKEIRSNIDQLFKDTARAEQITQSSEGFKFAKTVERIKNVFTEGFGASFISIINSMNESIGGLETVFSFLGKSILPVTTGFIAFSLVMTVAKFNIAALTANMSLAQFAAMKLGAAFAWVKANAIGLGITLATVVITALIQHNAARKRIEQDTINSINQINQKRLEQIQRDASKEITIFTTIQRRKLQIISQFFVKFIDQSKKVIDKLATSDDPLLDKIIMGPNTGAFKKLIPKVVKDFKSALSDVKGALQTSVDVFKELFADERQSEIDGFFDSFKSSTVAEVAKAIGDVADEVDILKDKARDAFADGNFDKAREALAESASIVDRLKSQKLLIFEDAAKNLKKSVNLIKDLKNQAADDVFDAATSGLSGAAKSAAIKKRIEDLRTEGLAAANAGDIDGARQKFEKIRGLIKGLISDQKQLASALKGTGISFGVDTALLQRNAQDRLKIEEDFVAKNTALVAAGKTVKDTIAAEELNIRNDRFALERDIQNALQKQFVQLGSLLKLQEDRKANLKKIVDLHNDLIAAKDRLFKLQQKLIEENASAGARAAGSAAALGTNEFDPSVKSVLDPKEAGANSPAAAAVNLRLAEEQKKFATLLQDNAATEEQRVASAKKLLALTKELRAVTDAEGITDKKLKHRGLLGMELSETDTVRTKTDQVIKDLETFLDTKSQLKKNASDLDTINKELIERDKMLKAYGLEIGALGNLEKAQKKQADKRLKQLQDELILHQQIVEAQRNQAKAATNPPPNVPTFATGGLIGGGPGRDNQLIAAHAGEYVSNANATRDFLPQLQAMNAGFKPKGFDNGGSVSNSVNMGDMNFNIASGKNAESTARRVGQILRREIRRGTIQLS
jgi:TP901 family phage tail tape measure protein